MRTAITVLLLACVFNASSQYTFFAPKEAFAIEVSLDQTPLKRLPIYRNGISSLAVAGDNIIAGTTANEGLTPFLFTASLSKRDMVNIFDLNNVVAGQRSVSTGFSRGKNNVWYTGTIANKNEKGEQPGGHLLEVK